MSFIATPPLAHLLHLCLVDPACSLPPHLRAALLAPFHLQGSAGSNGPFYKHLTNALLTCTETDAPSTTLFKLVASLKEVMWCPKFNLHVQEPYFSQLKAGSKTIEGRCAMGPYRSISSGDLLLLNNSLLQAVEMVKQYSSFEQMLKVEGLDRTLPGVSSLAEGVAIYRQFYSEEEERSRGVLAIYVKNAFEERQPLTMARMILEELALYEVEALQSFVELVGPSNIESDSLGW